MKHRFTSLRGNPISGFGLLVLTILFASSCFASTESARLVASGRSSLAAQDNKGALRAFQKASALDPLDASAWFGIGVAQVRSGSFSEALAMFVVAESMGYRGNDLKLERAKARVQLYDYAGAAGDLRSYLKESPNSPQARLLLGKCLLALGEPADAGSQLTKAEKLNPAYAGTVQAYRAKAEPVRTPGLTGRSSSGKEKIVVEPQAGAKKPWWLSFSTSVGWNSNVLALGQGISLPEGQFRKSAAFVNLNLDTGISFKLTDSTSLSLGYYLDQSFYESIPEANLMVNYWYATLTHRLDNRFSLLLTLGEELDAVGGAVFRNKLSVNPAIYARWNSWTSTLLGYSWSYSDFFFDLPEVYDRTGSTQRISLDQIFELPRFRSRLLVGYFHEFNLTTGSDFDYNADGIRVALDSELPWKIRARAAYEHVFYYYSNTNSLTGYSNRRNDGVDVVGVSLTRPVAGWLSVFAKYDLINNASNISYYSFDQHVVAAGLRLDL